MVLFPSLIQFKTPIRHDLEHPCDEPPPAGDIRVRLLPLDGAVDLPRGFLRRGAPEYLVSLRHARVHISRLDVGYIYRQVRFYRHVAQALQIVADEGLGGVIGRGVAPAADSGNRRYADEVTVALLDEVIERGDRNRRKAEDICVDGRFVVGPLQIGGAVAGAGADDHQIDAAHLGDEAVERVD